MKAPPGTRPDGAFPLKFYRKRLALRGRAGQQALALGALMGQLTGPAHRLGTLARALFRRLFVMVTALHLAESAFPLHLLLERLQRLVDVVIADENLYQDRSPVTKTAFARTPFRAGALI